MQSKMSFKVTGCKESVELPAVKSSYIFIDMPISLLLILVLSPIFLVNLLISKVQRKPFIRSISKYDCLGRLVTLHRCHCGFVREIGVLWSVVTQNIRFCGLPLQDSFSGLERAKLQRFGHCLAGLISRVGLHQLSGIAVLKPYDLIEQQVSAGRLAYLSLLVRGALSHFFFYQASTELKQPQQFTLFGLTIHNHSMRLAVEWALATSTIKKTNIKCKIGYFINVNSVNLTVNDPVLRERINRGDRCFADGSGMRIAAKYIGVRICENVNGTDMLPYLCVAAQKTKKSIYMLGSKPGVADKAAQHLLKIYPNLNIAGSQDGYFSTEQTHDVISRINQSCADILLVAMGSPIQEEWLEKNAAQLQCNTALAVGGLFDFYSGNITRAPLWMRELGMEWVWRLLQEPKTKFNRYVIGNPLFLIHTFIFNRAKRGFQS
ncbi:WecB/TagA/CpsF family glycosyltransferase [Brumicola pallidula]|jgi:N-acetylglucosaminyldiphosphoundecaprenol N-acetyl-beta-D-mannosaminyltransferase|uniref:WecB/TagA/CpsF family glycosyltransferase n=1 Tax=Brumicola pallidula TaxID=56807 RepID=UPI0011D1E27B|nr:WecB/TagA/CpsF family glycosyltransferase [Glaciecola pallidula]